MTAAGRWIVLKCFFMYLNITLIAVCIFHIKPVICLTESCRCRSQKFLAPHPKRNSRCRHRHQFFAIGKGVCANLFHLAAQADLRITTVIPECTIGNLRDPIRHVQHRIRSIISITHISNTVKSLFVCIPGTNPPQSFPAP